MLFLGGAAQQVIAIETAKELGYYTILCDFLSDNPGQYVADKFYLVSTTDKEEVLKVAKKENIDGILAYASDPAAPTAAYVAERMGLPGNPYDSVDILCNKDKFRKFLFQNGFNTPKSKNFSSKNGILENIKDFNFPVIVKPVDSSGSKGITVLDDVKKLTKAVNFAFSYSRAHRIIIEEFIEKKHEFLVGGDIFVKNGQIVLWGLLNCHRDNMVNPLVPVGKSYPLLLNEYDIINIKKILQKLIDKLKMKCGLINIELIIDKEDKVWLIDVGPRAGGNMIPDLLGLIYNTNVVKLSILAAMGKTIELDIHEDNVFFATHNLHCKINGIYRGIHFSPELEKFIIKKYLYKKNGDKVHYFSNAADALGIIFMKFSNEEQMKSILNNIYDYILIEVDSEDERNW